MSTHAIGSQYGNLEAMLLSANHANSPAADAVESRTAESLVALFEWIFHLKRHTNSTQFALRSHLNATCLLSTMDCVHTMLIAKRSCLPFHQRASDACVCECNACTQTTVCSTIWRLMFFTNENVCAKAHVAGRRVAQICSVRWCTETVLAGALWWRRRASTRKRTVKRATGTRYMPDEQAGHRQYESCVQRERLLLARSNPLAHSFPRATRVQLFDFKLFISRKRRTHGTDFSLTFFFFFSFSSSYFCGDCQLNDWRQATLCEWAQFSLFSFIFSNDFYF